MPPTPGPIRRGKAVNFTLDFDAHVLLRTMLPTNKGLGSLVSELIRKEAAERAQRPALLERLAAVVGSEASRE